MTATFEDPPSVTIIAGKYRPVRMLAKGGMGEVWAAENRSTGANVALKVLRPGVGNNDEAVQRLRQEARVGAVLAQRNIVRVFDLCEEPDGKLVLVMELLGGESLMRYLKRRGSLACREAVGIIAPVLHALGHAHAHNVLHRDVSTGNIFLALEPDGTVVPKLVDFGIARVEDTSLTTDSTVLGTPQYLAPERIRGDRSFEPRSDLFSAAVVLYEMMTGANPFAATTAAASLAAVLEREVLPHAAIEPALWFAMRRALSKIPSNRPATAEEFRLDILRAVGAEGVDAVCTLPNVVPVTELPQRVRAQAEFYSAETLAPRETLSPVVRRGLPLWPIVIAGALVGVLGSSLWLVTHRSSRTTTATAQTFERPAPSAEPAAVISAAHPEAPTTTPSASSSTGVKPPPGAPKSSPQRPTDRPASHIAPRGVATTPGF